MVESRAFVSCLLLDRIYAAPTSHLGSTVQI